MTGRTRAVTGPTLLVIAKAPVPGRSKTRLTPPCTPAQAAALAEAALADTFTAAAASGFPTVLALDGSPGPWLPPGILVVPQRGHGLDERLGAAVADTFAAGGGPVLVIGMDTPQVTPRLLQHCMATLAGGRVDAVLGSAPDGGWWAAGLRRAIPTAFRGVPMSTPFTGACQRARLQGLGLRVADLPPLRDVDLWEDALSLPVATSSRFAGAVAAVRRTLDGSLLMAGGAR